MSLHHLAVFNSFIFQFDLTRNNYCLPSSANPYGYSRQSVVSTLAYFPGIFFKQEYNKLLYLLLLILEGVTYLKVIILIHLRLKKRKYLLFNIRSSMNLQLPLKII